MNHENEILTNNVALKHCTQCEDCIYRDDGTVWSNDFRKSSCMMYPYPAFKPSRVMQNTGFCDFRKVKKNGR